MYKLVYNYKETVENKVLVDLNYFFGDTFRLKRFAVHYLLDIVQNEYREEGYGTEQVTGSAIYCYKSEFTEDKKRKTIQWVICVKKM